MMTKIYEGGSNYRGPIYETDTSRLLILEGLAEASVSIFDDYDSVKDVFDALTNDKINIIVDKYDNNDDGSILLDDVDSDADGVIELSEYHDISSSFQEMALSMEGLE
jgi:hypothetical protein